MSVNTSAIIYAFADQFVETRGRGGVQLPCRDVRVKKRDLAAIAITAALISLGEAGYVRLSLGTRRALFGLRKRPIVFAEPLQSAVFVGGLEGGLLASLDDDPDENALRAVIGCLLPMSGDPWADVIGRIEQGMLDQGYFAEQEREKKMARFFLGKKLDPDCQRIAELQEQVPSVRQRLDGFREANQELYDQLLEDVSQGIRARQEVDMDMD